ncbi:MAG: alkaline phosphatase family protein, partial [Thermomicrobiales bacterium]
MRRRQHRFVSFIGVLAILTMMSSPVMALQGATPESTPASEAGRAGEPVILFAADGMRPDLVAKYSDAGLMPTFAEMRKNGVSGDNGLLQAFPPNTG